MSAIESRRSRSNGVLIVRHVLWFLGVIATGFYVVIFCGFITWIGLRTGGFDLSRPSYSIQIIGAAVLWILALVARITLRNSAGFAISTTLLIVVAFLAVTAIFFPFFIN